MTRLGTARMPVYDAGDDPLNAYVNGLEWSLPRSIELREGRLRWEAWRGSPSVVRPTPGLLQRFVKLANASDASILRFAQRWGPLWMCEHGKPWQVDHYWNDCEVSEDLDRGDWCSETLDNWRMLAREARATLRIADRLRAGRLGEREDWESIRGKGTRGRGFGVISLVREGPWADDRGHAFMHLSEEEQERIRREWVPGGRTLEQQHRSFWNVMDGWVLRGGVRPFFEWGAKPGTRPSVRLGGYTLYGAIAVQVLFAVCQTEGLTVCTACGTPYVPPTRRPRWDQNPYCPDCGRKAAARAASARYRRTEKYQIAKAGRAPGTTSQRQRGQRRNQSEPSPPAVMNRQSAGGS